MRWGLARSQSAREGACGVVAEELEGVCMSESLAEWRGGNKENGRKEI